MPSTHRDEGRKGSVWAFTFKGKKINIYLQKTDLRMLEFSNTPSYSEAQLPGQEPPTEDTSGPWPHVDSCGSENDKGMTSAEDGIKGKKALNCLGMG